MEVKPPSPFAKNDDAKSPADEQPEVAESNLKIYCWTIKCEIL